MKGGSNDTSKCTVQAKHGRNGKVVFANLSRLGYSLAYVCTPPTLNLLPSEIVDFSYCVEFSFHWIVSETKC